MTFGRCFELVDGQPRKRDMWLIDFMGVAVLERGLWLAVRKWLTYAARRVVST